MKWNKKGHIFQTARQQEWMNSHAQCPTAVVLDDKIRIFFSARLPSQQSLPTFIDVDIDDPSKVLSLNPEPVLTRGKLGTFDENGIIPSYFMRNHGELYFYYAGWSRCLNVPYKNFTGLAISNDNGMTFRKFSDGPCFTLNEHDPLSATGPCIMERNGEFVAIYSTGTDWHQIGEKLEHTYLLTYATSKDAIHWKTTGDIIVQPNDEFEAICKPAIIEKDGLYHMWFSKRGSHNFRQAGGTSYRLGYATSTDLISWNRDDSKAGIDVSSSGWDSDMICYPHIVEANGKYFMFYNGNGFGRSGFGYAELEF